MAAEIGAAAVVKETATAEEEALKRNTDCVYFLASPLTCKKGSECDYRHSEGARVNPRDCWYWLNGNCLNQVFFPSSNFQENKALPLLFQPLDGMYGPPETSLPQGQLPATHASGYSANRQNAPCYYFQKGACLKGDRCSFMHGPLPVANSEPQTNGGLAPQQAAQVPLSSTELERVLKNNSQPIKGSNNLQQPKIVFEKLTEVAPPSVKPAFKAEASPSNDLVHLKSASHYPLELELPRTQEQSVPLCSNDRSRPACQIRPIDEHVQNGRGTDEFLAESSPGFDVLVDDDSEDPEYFHNEDEYRRRSGQGGRELNLGNDFNYQHSGYGPISQFERDQFNDEESEYDQKGLVFRHGDWEVQRRSSERVLDRSSRPDQRVSLRLEDNLSEIDRSDLRHRLKQRRLNNPRSAVSPDHRHKAYHRDDRYAEERRRAQHSSRDAHDYHLESSISSRLRGRITLPRNSPPDNPVDMLSEREIEKGRHRSRLSPSQPISNYQGRHLEKVRQRLNEEPPRDTRNTARQQVKRDEAETLDFAGPKSLAELKGAKSAVQDEKVKVLRNMKPLKSAVQHQELERVVSSADQDEKVKELRNMKPLKSAVRCQEPEGLVSFEGPKPLSNILKRKHESTPGMSAPYGRGDENQQKDSEGTTKPGLAATSYSKQHPLEADRKDPFEEEEEGLIHSEGDEHNDGQRPSSKEVLETDDVKIMDAMEEYPDLENDEQRDVEYEYEINEGGDFRTEEDNDMHPDDDEELDDDDDFAKKVGMMLS